MKEACDIYKEIIHTIISHEDEDPKTVLEVIERNCRQRLYSTLKIWNDRDSKICNKHAEEVNKDRLEYLTSMTAWEAGLNLSERPLPTGTFEWMKDEEKNNGCMVGQRIVPRYSDNPYTYSDTRFFKLCWEEQEGHIAWQISENGCLPHGIKKGQIHTTGLASTVDQAKRDAGTWLNKYIEDIWAEEKAK